MVYVVYLFQFNCAMPKVLGFTLTIDLIIFIYLFMDFYKITYRKNKILQKIIFAYAPEKIILTGIKDNDERIEKIKSS